MSISFTVPLPPKGKGRPRFARTAGGHVRAYTPNSTVAYEDAVRRAYIAAAGGRPPAEGAVSIEITAFFAIPKSTPKRAVSRIMEEKPGYTKRPDWDNVAKLVCDALNGLAYKDDAQIATAQVKKLYCVCGDTPHLSITLDWGY